MWILNFLPDWVFHFTLLLGLLALVGAYFLNFIPFVGTYRKQLQLAGIVLVVTAVWYEGGIAKDKEYREKIADLKAKIAIAEAKSQVVNTVIEERIVYRDRVIKEKADKIIKYVDRPVLVEFDKTCPLPKDAIEVHNEAARMNYAIEEIRKGEKK